MPTPHVPGSKTAESLIAENPNIRPLRRRTGRTTEQDQDEATPTTEAASTSTSSSEKPTTTTTIDEPSTLQKIGSLLAKPFYFLFFILLHLGNEMLISARSIKLFFRLWFLPHQFPVSPTLSRILRDDVEKVTKLPNHLAVIMELDGYDEDGWQDRVCELAQWSVGSGIRCLSIMRKEAMEPKEFLDLQGRLEDSFKEFFEEEYGENNLPTVLARILPPVGATVLKTAETERLLKKKNHLDLVILSEEDGHDRLAGNVKALGEAARNGQVTSQEIDMEYLDRQWSVNLSEPDLLIIFKDALDLSSYPPWHIRLTEIFHLPDQALLPQYTMFLQALDRFSKCEQRFGA